MVDISYLEKCLEKIAFVSFLICTLCTHNSPAQQAATEISSLGTSRGEIVSTILNLESSITGIPLSAFPSG